MQNLSENGGNAHLATTCTYDALSEMRDAGIDVPDNCQRTIVKSLIQALSAHDSGEIGKEEISDIRTVGDIPSKLAGFGISLTKREQKAFADSYIDKIKKGIYGPRFVNGTESNDYRNVVEALYALHSKYRYEFSDEQLETIKSAYPYSFEELKKKLTWHNRMSIGTSKNDSLDEDFDKLIMKYKNLKFKYDIYNKLKSIKAKYK